ncbi:unnamed protein product [Ectocarpus sp. 13 AM-2016]
MDGDGDILGMRRRPEPAQPADPTTALAGNSAAVADAAPEAGAAAARHAAGASPLKRQRSLAAGAAARAEGQQ